MGWRLLLLLLLCAAVAVRGQHGYMPVDLCAPPGAAAHNCTDYGLGLVDATGEYIVSTNNPYSSMSYVCSCSGTAWTGASTECRHGVDLGLNGTCTTEPPTIPTSQSMSIPDLSIAESNDRPSGVYAIS